MDGAVEAVTANAVNSVGQNIGSLINLAISRVVGAFMSPSKDDQRREMNEFYDRMKTIADNSNYTRAAADPFHGASPRERVMQELDTVDSLVVQSIDNLKKARDMSRCGVCRHDLDATAKMVEKSVKPVFDATDKVRAIQMLKEDGRLPRDKMWETLNRDEKKAVVSVAHQIKASRDAKTEYVGGVIGGEEEEEYEDENLIKLSPKKQRAKPKRAKQAKPKRRKTKRG